MRGVLECSHRGGFVAAQNLVDLVGTQFIVHDRRADIERAAGIGIGRQRFVFHLDRVESVECLVAVFSDDGGNDVADVVDLFVGEGGTQDLAHRPPVGERHRVHAGEFP